MSIFTNRGVSWCQSVGSTDYFPAKIHRESQPDGTSINRPLYLRMQIVHFRSRHSLEKCSFVQIFTRERINSQE